jgi:two-component system osmolarity sensor histidine kinase EnvZ
MISPAHRRRLNRALHELRRPLQTLALLDEAVGVPATSPQAATRRGLMELAGSALAELDAVVNGGEPAHELRRVSCRELVLASLERWRPAAAESGGIRVFWDAGPAPVEGDPVGMARALDNLIANALEHGGPPLVVTGARVAGRLRITVANGGPERSEPPSRRPEPRRDDDDPRHGHGVELVSEVAAAHHGRFALCRTGSGCVAALELPLAEAELAQAA